MEKFLTKKRKITEDESERVNKKRRINASDDDEDYALSNDEECFFEDSDVENNSNNNMSKDAQIKKLKKELQAMTNKYNKMKAENEKLKKKIKTTSAKSSKNSNNKQKSEKEIARMKKKYLKKWSVRLPKVAGMKKTKFIGCSKEIIVEEIGFDKEDFEALFGDKGYLVQPRPDNKPKSTVIIRRFASFDEINEIFKDYGLSEKITVSIWRNRNFSKSMYYGDGEAKIESLCVHYNKSRKVLQLKFLCQRDYESSGFGGFFFL